MEEATTATDVIDEALRHDALKGLERSSLQSKKFIGYLAGLVAFVALVLGAFLVLAFVAYAAPSADLSGLANALTSPLTVVSWPMMLIVLGYVGGTSWQERGVRIAAITGRGPGSLLGGKD